MIARALPLVPDGAVLVANGKQALSLVAQDLRDRGVRTLLTPDYYCLTMIEPFQLEGIHVQHVATDARALMDAQTLHDALGDGTHVAVLHCETYGARADTALREVLAGARAAGIPVVVDATHSLFDASHDPADYLVASLRKLLPIPDGAFVTGVAGPADFGRGPADDEATRLGLVALQLRTAFRRGECSMLEYLAALDAPEDAMLDARTPADMSPIALQALRDIDATALRAARRMNAQRVIAHLRVAGLEVLNPDNPECGVVVRAVDADAAEQALLQAGIVCPISWPRPPGLAGGVAWRTGLITLPVDAQLSPGQLDRSADVAVSAAAAARDVVS